MTGISDDPIISPTLFHIRNGVGFVLFSTVFAKAGTRAYKWALDNAAIQVQSGAISYNQAIANATKLLADSGLEVISYESGHRDQVDVAVRRAVMTGVNQLNSQYADESLDYNSQNNRYKQQKDSQKGCLLSNINKN